MHLKALLSCGQYLGLCIIQQFLTYKIVLIFRPGVSMCHKRHTEEINTDQKAKLEVEISQSCDYYNLIPETALPAGHFEHVQLTKDQNRLGIGIQKVKT